MCVLAFGGGEGDTVGRSVESSSTYLFFWGLFFFFVENYVFEIWNRIPDLL